MTALPDSLCPGDTVVLTCVTDTGRLDWTFGKSSTLSFYKVDQIGIPLNKSVFFTVILQNITGDDNNMFRSSVTVSHHVPLSFSETVSCSDGPGGIFTEHNISVGKNVKTIVLQKPNY